MKKTIMDKLNEGRQYRNFATIEKTDEKSVEGYATVFSEPYELFRDGQYSVWEQVDPHAFDETEMDDVIMQYNHEGRVFARKSNGTLEIQPDESGLHVRADLGGTEIGRQLYEEIAGGYTTKMSFGFRVGKDEFTETENHDTGEVRVLRTILGISKLFDVSAVSLPANDATSISARNFGEGVIAEVKQEMQTRLERERQKKRIKILSEV